MAPPPPPSAETLPLATAVAVEPEPAKVGELACQRDTYLTALTATVASCQPVPAPKGDSSGGKQGGGPAEFHEIVLSDTVLFPTGGGQPHDLGSIAGVPVVDVFRRGMDCVHLTRATPAHRAAASEAGSSWPPAVGAAVAVQLDWARRRDHAVQHTGQHLLSALAETPRFALPTVSWGMGGRGGGDGEAPQPPAPSYVEIALPTGAAPPTSVLLRELEEAVNAVIRRALPVTTEAVRPVEGGVADVIEEP
ncbi:Alanyl-tRNA editing protein Aarsd1, partial [Cladochytrium tenue]